MIAATTDSLFKFPCLRLILTLFYFERLKVMVNLGPYNLSISYQHSDKILQAKCIPGVWNLLQIIKT